MARGASSNGEGTLVDTIHYESTGVTLTDAARTALAQEPDPDNEGPETSVGKVKIPIEVRLRKHFSTETGRDRPVGELQFALVCRRPAITLRGTDIEVLRAAMWAELDKDSAIAWEQYMLVTIEPAMSYGEGVSEGLRLNTETVWKGTTRDGLHLLRQLGRSRLEVHGWAYRPWPGAFTDRAGRVTACIPATAANEAAMEEFRVRIREMRERLKDLVRPERILQTLADLSGVALIAGPPDERT